MSGMIVLSADVIRIDTASMSFLTLCNTLTYEYASSEHPSAFSEKEPVLSLYETTRSSTQDPFFPAIAG
jgi:hypothetical protein